MKRRDLLVAASALAMPSLARGADGKPLRLVTQPDLAVHDPSGTMGMMRPNLLHPPFSNPAFRRAIAGAISQADFMTAAGGPDRANWSDGIGVFCPASPMASPPPPVPAPDMVAVRKAVEASGYAGEKVVLLGVDDIPIVKALCDVGADMFRRIGVNLDYLAMDAGAMVQRRARQEPPEQGGWSVFFTYWGGLDMFDPAVAAALQGNGRAGWFGWADMPELEKQRQAWLDAPDLPAQQAIAADIQRTCLQERPFYMLGQLMRPTVYQADLQGMNQDLTRFGGIGLA